MLCIKHFIFRFFYMLNRTVENSKPLLKRIRYQIIVKIIYVIVVRSFVGSLKRSFVSLGFKVKFYCLLGLSNWLLNKQSVINSFFDYLTHTISDSPVRDKWMNVRGQLSRSNDHSPMHKTGAYNSMLPYWTLRLKKKRRQNYCIFN